MHPADHLNHRRTELALLMAVLGDLVPRASLMIKCLDLSESA